MCPPDKKADSSIPDSDTSLGHNASNAEERWQTLQWCFANNWAGLDIGRLERSDTDTFHGWLMWKYRQESDAARES